MVLRRDQALLVLLSLPTLPLPGGEVRMGQLKRPLELAWLEPC